MLGFGAISALPVAASSAKALRQTYPALPIELPTSSQDPITDLVLDAWPSGGSRTRSYFTGGRFAWVATHPVVTDADRALLKAFFDLNRTSLFDFVSPYDGLLYPNVAFVAPLTYEPLPGGYWNVRAKIRQFR